MEKKSKGKKGRGKKGADDDSGGRHGGGRKGGGRKGGGRKGGGRKGGIDVVEETAEELTPADPFSDFPKTLVEGVMAGGLGWTDKVREVITVQRVCTHSSVQL